MKTGLLEISMSRGAKVFRRCKVYEFRAAGRGLRNGFLIANEKSFGVYLALNNPNSFVNCGINN